MRLRLGMCGFTIARGTYYKQFDVVEVQQTFYDPPPPLALARWRAHAPASFEFTMKAWQVITHFGTSRTYRRLRSPFSDNERAEAGGFRRGRSLHPPVFDARHSVLAPARQPKPLRALLGRGAPSDQALARRSRRCGGVCASQQHPESEGPSAFSGAGTRRPVTATHLGSGFLLEVPTPARR